MRLCLQTLGDFSPEMDDERFSGASCSHLRHLDMFMSPTFWRLRFEKRDSTLLKRSSGTSMTYLRADVSTPLETAVHRRILNASENPLVHGGRSAARKMVLPQSLVEKSGHNCPCVSLWIDGLVFPWILRTRKGFFFLCPRTSSISASFRKCYRYSLPTPIRHFRKERARKCR